MRFNIRCDMEGATGVTSYDQVRPDNPSYAEGRDLFMGDLLAVIDGVMAADPAAEVTLYDEHMQGRNVRNRDLPPGVRSVCGKPAYDEGCAGFLEGCAAMLLVGFHGRAGAPGALLPHTYEHDILDLQVNGESVGEVGLEAIIAGELDVPAIFCSGDSVGTAEMQAVSPAALTVSVKQALGATAALCLPAAQTAPALREAAGLAVARLREIPPVPRRSPAELRWRLKSNAYRAALESLETGLFDGSGTVVIKRASVLEAYAHYWRCKERAKAAMGG